MYDLEKRVQRDMAVCHILLAAVLTLTVVGIVKTALAESDKKATENAESAVKSIEETPLVIEAVITPQPESAAKPEELVIRYYDVPLSEELQDHIFAECEYYDVDPTLIISIIKKESEFRDWVVGDKGRSYGLMQIQERWHEERMDKLQVTDLLNPYQNVTVGIDYLAELLDRNKGVEWALMAYNGGPSYANKLRAKNMVSDYAKTVLGYSKELEMKMEV